MCSSGLGDTTRMATRSAASRLSEVVVAAAGGAFSSHAVRLVDAKPRGRAELVSMYVLASQPACAPTRPVVAFVDNNTSAAVPLLLRAMEATVEQATPADVKYIIVTHVHLDHAAGTGVLLRLCPNAIVLCHPRAKGHLVGPSALIRSAKKTYSPEEFVHQVGDMLPCPAERVRTVGDGESVELAEGRTLTFHHVEGHAKHHVIIEDPATESVFTGDSFGVCFNDVRHLGLRDDTVVPTSTPVDFDFEQAMAAVDKIERLPVRWAWPTHFGVIRDIPDAAAQMRLLLPRYEAARVRAMEALKQSTPQKEVLARVEAELDAIMRDHFRSRGLVNEPPTFWSERVKFDREINSLGLVVAAARGLAKL
jgi:glyoxylase-like metal-dependent hydrolase (beta-lactamase superfamily II)